MYRGPRPHRGTYPPAESRGPPPASSFSSAPYSSEHARGSNGYPHGYRRNPEHPRRRYSSPGRGDGPPRDHGHRYTPSPPHDGLPSDHRLVITVGNELPGLSQRTGADIPYARDYSPHQSNYEVHDERSSSRHVQSRYGNRGWSRSPDNMHSRIRPRSRSRSPAGCHSRAINQEHRRPRSRSQSRGRSRSRGRSWSKNNKSVNEGSRELKGAYLCKELGDMVKMPTKSILKKKVDSSETDSPMIGQMDLTSPGQCAYFPVSKQSTNDDLAFLRSSGPSHTAFKRTCNSSSVLSNQVDLFRRLINEASTSSHKLNNKAIVYDQKRSREIKVQSSTPTSHLSRFSQHDCEQGSTSESFSTQSSATEKKSNLATQMDRFLGALNKGDSKFLSSLVKHTRKDTDRVGNQRIPQEQARRIVSCGDKLYDRGEDNSPLMGSKLHMNHVFGRVDTQDDLLPHERAVVDGSGFSKIVGMKCGIEAKPENRILYRDAIPSSSQSRLLEEPKKFLKECDKFQQSQDRIDMAHLEDSYAEDRKRYKGQSAAKSYKIEGSLSPVHHILEDAKEDTDEKANQYKKIQDLLQTIGLNLDTTEVSKLADRTNERLYGKKVKPRSSRSFDKKNEPLVSRYDRRGGSNSTDSEDVGSVSPAKTSNREVYMSNLDSFKNRLDEVAVRQRDLSTLERTIRDIPEAKQSDSYKTMPLVATHDAYKLPAEEPLLTQSVSLPYPPISSEFSSAAPNFENKQDVQNYRYTMGEEQNPYKSISPNPLHYTTGYPIPPSHPMLPSSFPSGYAYYRPPAMPLSMMPPSHAQFFPPPFTFNAPKTFGPPPAPPYPPPLDHFGFAMQPGSSGFVTQQAKTKATVKNRCLKTIETVQTQESVSCKISAAKEVDSVISIQTEKEHKDTEDEAESQTVPTMEDDMEAKGEKKGCSNPLTG
ncbi:uncharacterized protein Hap1MRO34_009829 isoform 2-T2 [Clarias gariepinus]|uniref:zinc finger protein 318-like isoform X2 n=1 Tax=Clarias gariepinus TaxID=13013 RepID=UPI00234C07B0|nr:zinc finger protein 318-like isoform X2 [Clarias gariepinus]